MEYEKFLSAIAAAITIISAILVFLKKLFYLRKSIFEELWNNAFPWKIKNYIDPRYTIEEGKTRKRKLDKLLTKLLLKNNQKRIVLVVGESGVGKSFLCVKVYHRLIIRTAAKGHHLKYVNAAMLENFDELRNNPNAKKTILFLDGLDEYHQFLKPHDLQETKELYFNLHKVLSEYGRVVISARSNYYIVNKDHVDWVCYHLAGCDMQKVIRITLTGLEDKQIQKYLKQKLKLKNDKIEKCIHLVHSSKEILSRPVFLQFLEILPEGINYVNSYKVYEEIVKAWMRREKDKSISSSNPLGKANLAELFNQLTESYFKNLFAGHAVAYFYPEEIINPQFEIEDAVLASRALLKYDSKYGYYCIHHSFFEFNYVRLHYKEMYRRGMKEKKFLHRSLKTFYEECHYNRTFNLYFPQAEVILLGSGKKSLSNLRPEEAGRTIQFNILHAEDLLNSEFKKFIQGFYYSSFMLGVWKINNMQLRCLLQNNYLNLSEWKIESAYALEWFHSLPIIMLNLSHTGIRKLDFLKNFPLVERFVSVGNPLESIREVEQCTNLRYLNLSNCGLTSNILKIRWPEFLRELIVSNNEISNLTFVSSMCLDKLDVSDNPLKSDAESFMRIPDKVRCTYHFKSEHLKTLILNERQFSNTEIQYGDIMSFLQNNGDTVQLNDEISSVFGLENICCKSIMFPLKLIPALNTLRKPLHIDRAVILAEHGYKLGYALNKLFDQLNICSKYQLTLESALELRDKCDSLIDYLADYTVNGECYRFKCNDGLKGMMDMKTFQLCLEEVFLIAGICLKCMWQTEINTKDRVLFRKIDKLACGYMREHPAQDYLRLEDLKNLSEQHRKFSKQGKVYERAINMIRSNTKGLSEIIWSLNNRKHTVMTFTYKEK